ncbi:carboxymuconolactone decarboxylase family protein [Roseixanthobacter glucoisosaccharinicivorans]|uniref:carboxymuconolactone decarboxylase family protein n=1 Tax=Roseixanthobacter glucoisosaccharinicivorans TaxID=3119923 RepID=UPI00372B580B
MSRIPIPSAEGAPQASRALLAEAARRLGGLPNFFRIVANSPSALEALVGFYGALEKGALDPLIRERIALAVAEVNGSDYCLSAQTYRVREMHLLDDTEITANRNGASNDIRANAAVSFAAKLARGRGQVTDTDFAAVKDAGFSDAEIVEIVAHVALNIFAGTANIALQTDIDFPHIGARKAA